MRGIPWLAINQLAAQEELCWNFWNISKCLPGISTPERQINCSYSSGATVKDKWSYTFTAALRFYSLDRVTLSGVPRNIFSGGEGGGVQNFNWWQRADRTVIWVRYSLVGGSTEFANEWNPYSDWVVTDVFSTELGISAQLCQNFGISGEERFKPPNPPRYATVALHTLHVPTCSFW
jgi:hypothetical protein